MCSMPALIRSRLGWKPGTSGDVRWWFPTRRGWLLGRAGRTWGHTASAAVAPPWQMNARVWFAGGLGAAVGGVGRARHDPLL
jgi:hypothetical protein